MPYLPEIAKCIPRAYGLLFLNGWRVTNVREGLPEAVVDPLKQNTRTSESVTLFSARLFVLDEPSTAHGQHVDAIAAGAYRRWPEESARGLHHLPGQCQCQFGQRRKRGPILDRPGMCAS